MRAPLLKSLARLLSGSIAALALGACGAGAPPPPPDPLTAMRHAAEEPAADGEALGRLLLGEMFSPGGDAARAVLARKRLDALGPAAGKGMFAALARAVDDGSHGRSRGAASGYLDALAAARLSEHPDAPMVAWFAVGHLVNLRSSVAGLWAQGRDVVRRTLDQPGHVGWRARGELVEWWSLDGFREERAAGGEAPASGASAGMLEALAKRIGCADKARMAGPFGHVAAVDQRAHFEAEKPGPWPAVFARDPRRQVPPRILPIDRVGCALKAIGAPGAGIYYVETFVDLPAEREVIVAVQGALAVFVDDAEVMTRDTRRWGIWPRFGAHLRLDKGRHRILARIGGAESSIRLLTSAGLPIDGVVSDDPAPPYAIAPPLVLDDPNAIDPFMAALGVAPQPGVPRPATARDTRDPVSRVLAAALAHNEGQDDVSSVLIEPLVKDPERATGPALAMQAVYLEKDPIFPESDARDLAKDLRARAAAKDPELWWPRFWLLLDEAEKSGVPEVAPKVVELADHFREVPEIIKGLSAIYGRVGWKVEHEKAVKETAARFPDDADALGDLLHLYDEEGQVIEADKVAARIRALDPDAEVDFDRALARRDFQAARQELERLRAVRKDRRDIAARIADLLTRAGQSNESIQRLEAAVQKKPEDAEGRLALADARLAGGDKGALREALVAAIHGGADTTPLREAIELVDGITELSPYRLDGKKVIAEYEASKREMPGTAARVLDYSAIWVHPDGSARMLEHEIIGIQSREGIQEHAEQRLPRGLLLRIRTIKHDGQVLEPEIVEGKQTVTMPHLEVGDYIETETVTTLRGDGQGGQRFEGPRWFFREEKIPYWRSEFIVISPKQRPLDVEVGGPVPAAQVTESGALVIRRWRVDLSPALPEEPASAPIQEFLPNVRIGWGINLADTVARMVDAASDETPRDPRLARVAEGIVLGRAEEGKGKPSAKAAIAPASEGGAGSTFKGVSLEERARRIYRWVLSNVEAGRETDGRKSIIGKSGNRLEAFLYLCRLAGVEATLGVVRDRLAPPATGPMSEAETFGALAVRVVTEGGPRWMVVREKFAPYGYMPSSMRGQPAIVLSSSDGGAADPPRETTPTTGSIDGVSHRGTVDVAADGSATLDIVQRYEGKLAILLRGALETLPDARLKETIESRLLPQSLPGARVLSVEVKNLTDIDQPLELVLKLEMSNFARARPAASGKAGGELVISPPFPIHLASLAGLPSRETPLYISEQIATRVSMQLEIRLPAGATVATALEPASADDGDVTSRVRDHAGAGSLVLDRVVDLPAGRVQPAAYARFQEFARKADSVLHRDVVVSLAGKP